MLNPRLFCHFLPYILTLIHLFLYPPFYFYFSILSFINGCQAVNFKVNFFLSIFSLCSYCLSPSLIFFFRHIFLLLFFFHSFFFFLPFFSFASSWNSFPTEPSCIVLVDRHHWTHSSCLICPLPRGPGGCRPLMGGEYPLRERP